MTGDDMPMSPDSEHLISLSNDPPWIIEGDE